MSRGQRRCRRPVSRGGGSSPASGGKGSSPAAASRWGSGSAVRAAQAGAMAAVEEGKGPPPPPGTLTAGRDAPGAGAADPAERTPNPRTPGPRTRRQPPPHAHRAQERLWPLGEREREGWGRRGTSRMRHHRACSLEAARSAGVRASRAGIGDRGRECASVCWAGPYRTGRYVSANVLNIHEINKKSDTLWIRIHHVSDAYPYRIRIRYGIRGLPHVSV